MPPAHLSRTRTAPDNRPIQPLRATSSVRNALRRALSSPEDQDHNDFHQFRSPQFMDDHGAHTYHVSATRSSLEESDEHGEVDNRDLNEKETRPAPTRSMSLPTLSDDDDETMSGSTAGDSREEVRFGVVNSRDVEAGPPPDRPNLVREKTNRSVKDPNLVSPMPASLIQS
jgi:hypothetical protein